MDMSEHQGVSREDLLTSPYLLILLFGIAGLFGLFYILLGHHAPKPGTSGRVPHSPSEFRSVLDKEDPLAGLPENQQEVAGEFPHDPPPWETPDIFPCSGCHSEKDEVNLNPRKLRLDHKKIVLNHGGENRWCFDCHNPADRDKLRLANGTLIDFKESYRLCGQCHGDKYRDWRDGIHGRRTGYWSGAKRYMLCANCHNPHAPHFAPLVPLPPPVRPEWIQDDKRLSPERTPKP